MGCITFEVERGGKYLVNSNGLETATLLETRARLHTVDVGCCLLPSTEVKASLRPAVLWELRMLFTQIKALAYFNIHNLVCSPLIQSKTHTVQYIQMCSAFSE